jgi:hypothetical protein
MNEAERLRGWARRNTPSAAQIIGAEAQGARLDADWTTLRSLNPGDRPDADVVALIIDMAESIAATEARVHAGSGAWARVQRIALQGEAVRLVPDALGHTLIFGPEWTPLT